MVGLPWGLPGPGPPGVGTGKALSGKAPGAPGHGCSTRSRRGWGAAGREAGSPSLSFPHPHLQGLLSTNLFPSLNGQRLTGRERGRASWPPRTKCDPRPTTAQGDADTPFLRAAPSTHHLPYVQPTPRGHPHFLMENPRHAGVKSSVRDHGAGTPQGRELNPHSLAPLRVVLRPRNAQEEAQGALGRARGDSLPSSGRRAQRRPHWGVSGVPRPPSTSPDPPAPLPFQRVELTPIPVPSGPCPAPCSQSLVDYDLGTLDSGREEDPGKKIKGITFLSVCA